MAKPAPLLVIVTGMPASGKTTLARGLAHELLLPLVTKDGLKEELYGELGIGDVHWSRRLGAAAYALIFAFCRELLATGEPALAEANFFSGSHEEHFVALPPHRLVQLYCSVPLDLVLARYGARTDRHPGHLDSERVVELRQRFDDGVHRPLALAGEIIEIDTSRDVDIQSLAARIRPRL